MSLTVKLIIVGLLLVFGVGGILYVQRLPSESDKKGRKGKKGTKGRGRTDNSRKKPQRKRKPVKKVEDDYDDDDDDDYLLDDEEYETGKKSSSTIMQIEQPFNSLIQMTYLIQEIRKVDKTYKITIHKNNEDLFTKYFNTSYVMEILGRFLYSGEMELSEPSDLEIMNPKYLPYNTEDKLYEGENVRYVQPCKTIGEKQFNNSIYGAYVKSNNLIEALSRQILNATYDELVEPKSKSRLGVVETYSLHQLLEYLFLTKDERQRVIGNEMFDNIRNIFGVEDDDELVIKINPITNSESSMITQNDYILKPSMNRWYLTYKNDSQFAFKVRKEVLYEVIDVLDQFKGSRKKEELEEMKSLLTAVMGIDFTEMHLKDIHSFINEYIQESVNVIVHVRERLCIVKQGENHIKKINIFNKLPVIKGL